MIDKTLFDSYAQALETVCGVAHDYILALWDEVEGMTAAQAKEYLLLAYSEVVAKTGSLAANSATEFYDSQRAAAGVSGEFEAQVYTPDNEKWLRQDIADTFKIGVTREGAAKLLAGSGVQRTMEYADDTLSYNSKYDPAHPKWALVPRANACDWCVMICSNGFFFNTAGSAKSARHSNCKCVPVVDFDTKNPSLEGYHPDELYRRYKDCKDTIEDVARNEWNAMSAEERKKYESKGKSAWDNYLTRRTQAEMRLRDRTWLNTGEAPRVTFENSDVESNVLPHELRTAERLAKHGIAPCFVQDYEWVKDENGRKFKVGKADLSNGIEIKTVQSSRNAEGAMINYLNNASKKKDLTRVVIDNSESEYITDKNLVKAALDQIGNFSNIPRVTVLTKTDRLIDIK